jgi:hypothetical protein
MQQKIEITKTVTGTKTNFNLKIGANKQGIHPSYLECLEMLNEAFTMMIGETTRHHNRTQNQLKELQHEKI